MKISTLRLANRNVAARLDGDTYTEIPGFSDVGQLLQNPMWRTITAAANGPTHHVDAIQLAPVVPDPGKIFCIGMNYREHIVERAEPFPEYPTVFAKFSDALAGAHDIIPVPPEDKLVDWEGELAVVIGTSGRRIDATVAHKHIAGYTVLNDISMRGYQSRTKEWLQGKTWQNSTPIGPVLATADELPENAKIQTSIDGQIVQQSTIGDFHFEIAEIIAYLSTIVTLKPGDVISTGTPSGVGVAQMPKRFLQNGEVLETTIEGIGTLRNLVAFEIPHSFPAELNQDLAEAI